MKLPDNSEGSLLEQYLFDLKRVNKNGLALKFVEEQTPEICMAAIQQNRNAITHKRSYY